MQRAYPVVPLFSFSLTLLRPYYFFAHPAVRLFFFGYSILFRTCCGLTLPCPCFNFRLPCCAFFFSLPAVRLPCCALVLIFAYPAVPLFFFATLL